MLFRGISEAFNHCTLLLVYLLERRSSALPDLLMEDLHVKVLERYHDGALMTEGALRAGDCTARGAQVKPVSETIDDGLLISAGSSGLVT